MRNARKHGSSWLRRAVALVVALTLVLGEMGPLASLGWNWATKVNAVTAFTKGDGTESKPYEIPTEEYLRYFASLPASETQGKYYKLTGDITLTKAWNPMKSFAGTLDGNGHTISGLTITATSTDAYGLFARVTGTVKNLTVSGTVSVTDTTNDGKYTGIGLLVGELNGGTLDNCVSEGTVTTTLKVQQFVGGLAGLVYPGSTIINCGNTATVTASNDNTTATTTRVGGVAGYAVIGRAANNDILVANCYNLGTITHVADKTNNPTTHKGNSGGVIGLAQNSTGTAKADSSYALFTMLNCYSAGSTEGQWNSVANFSATNNGKIIGKNLYYNQNQYIDPKDTTHYDITAEKFTSATDGTLLGKLNTGVANFAGALEWEANAENYPVPKFVHKVAVSWATPENGTLSVTKDNTEVTNYAALPFGTELTVTVTPNSGYVLKALKINGESVPVTDNTYELKLTQRDSVSIAAEFALPEPEGPVEISDAAGLAAIKNDLDGEYILTEDITLTVEWTPIADFSGTLDGNGHTISGLTISNADSASNVGLFATVLAGATIENVTLKDVSINVTVNGNKAVSVGALVGKVDIVIAPGKVTIDNCAVIGDSSITVTAPEAAGWKVFAVGGIVGNALGNNSSVGSTVSITNCYNSADLIADNSAVASNGAQIELGGIVGAAYCDDKPTGEVSYKIINCGNTGDLTVRGGVAKEVGGIVGRGRTGATAGTYVINNCYSTGAMSGPASPCPIVYTKGGIGQTISNTYYYAAAANNNTSSTLLTEDQVTDGTLLGNLNTNRAAIDGALNWVADATGHPVPSTKVQVSWTAPQNGALTVTKEDNTPVNSGDTLKEGDKIIITVTPAQNYKLNQLKVNGSPVTVTENKYTHTLGRDDVVIAAEFAAVTHYWTDTGIVATDFAGGTGEKDDPFQIATGAELAYLVSQTDTAGKYYKLTADIDLSANEWVPIEKFEGHFDGNGKTITGLKITGNYDTAQDLGLFGAIYAGATIRNVTLKDVNIDVTQTADKAMSVGALVGKIEYTETSAADTLIDNCFVVGNSTVRVTANAIGAEAWTGIRVGGLIGNLDADEDASGTTIVINCFNEADVTVTATSGGGSAAVGGVAGALIVNGNNATFHLLNSGSIGALTASTAVQQGFVGGVAGWTKGQNASVTKPTVDNCYSAGTMTGGTKIGNIVAQSGNVDFDWTRLYGVATGGSIAGTTITAEQVTDGTLLSKLNANKTSINDARGWAANAAGYPMPTVAVEPPVNVQVSWTAPQNGALTVTKEDSAAVTSPATLPSGTKLTIMVAPANGYVLKELKIDGEVVGVANGTYTLVLPRKDSVTITAEFEIPTFLWTDDEVVASGFAGGTGEKDDPFQIATGAQLGYLATRTDTAGKYYKLTADIDLSANEWVPIEKFEGHFDGNGKTITGLNISGNYNAAVNLGLFGSIHVGATIQNVVLKDVNINVTQTAAEATNVGALVGFINHAANASGDILIDNCYVIGDSTISVTANALGTYTGVRVGGLIGNLDANASASGTTIVINCFNEADVTVTATSGGGSVALGGIGGYMGANGNNATFHVLNSGSVGTLTASATVTQGFVGGVVGWTKGQNASVTKPTVDNCYSAGTMTGGTKIGNIVAQSGNVDFDWTRLYGVATGGSIAGTTITAEQVTDGTLLGKLNANKTSINDARGWAANAEGYPVPSKAVEPPVNVQVSWTAPQNGTLTVTKEDSAAVTSPATLPSGTKLTITVTPANGYVLKELKIDGEVVGVANGTYTLVLPRKDSVTITAEFEIPTFLWTDDEVVASGFAGGTGEKDDPFQIATGAQLGYLATRTDTAGKYYKLTADIDLSANEWAPIKKFEGHFDGNGKTITGLTIDNNASESDLGLFGSILGGSTVKNVILKDVNIHAIVAANTGNVSVGAVVGRIDIVTKAGKVEVVNCLVMGESSIDVTTNHTKWAVFGMGGIVGAAVPDKNSGASSISIINCFNTADLATTEKGGKIQINMGGIVGAAYCDDAINDVNYYLVNCGNTGDLTVNSSAYGEAGGIAGRFRTKAKNSTSVMNNCYHTGMISGTALTKLCPIVYTHTGGTDQSIANVYYYMATEDNVKDSTGATKLKADEVTNGTLLGKLDANVTALGMMGYQGAHKWQAQVDGTPIPTGEEIVIRDVQVSVNNATADLGTIKIEVDGVEVNSWPQTVKSGTVITIIGTPAAGCKVESITVNGKQVEGVSNITKITVTEDKNVIEVKFGRMHYWTDDGAYATEFAGGTGTQEDPYLIANAGQLAWLAKEMQSGKQFKDTYFKLTDNIDLSQLEWMTMLSIAKNAQGNVVYRAFAGHFDGNGKTIKGMKIDTEANPVALPHVGLFGIVSGTVKNLTVEGNINVKDTGVNFGGVGMIAGYLQGGTVTDCITKGSITAVRTQAFVGGIAGIAEAGSTIINCVNFAAISAGHTGIDTTDEKGNKVPAAGRIGGIAGYTIAGGSAKAGVIITNCGNVGNITAIAGNGTEAAGITGRVEINPKNGQTISIFNCYNAGKIQAKDDLKDTLLGNILARKSQDGKLESGNLYGASALKDPSLVTVTVEDNMKSDAFASTLSNNTKELADSGIAGLRKWRVDSDGYPVPIGDTVVVPNFVVNQPTVSGGTVEVMLGEEKVTTFPLTVTAGTVVTLVCTPSSGNMLRDVTVNGVALINPQNTLELKITADSSIAVQFGPPEYWHENGIAASGFAGGDGSKNNPYQISNGAHLGYLAQQSLAGEIFAGKYFKLTANIDLSAYTWTPIAGFAGILDGNGKTISGMKINKVCNEFEAIGLFGTVYGGAAIKNLTLQNVNVTVNQTASVATNVGGLIGQVVIDKDHGGKVTIDKCSVSGKIVVTTKVTVTYCDTAVGGNLGYTKPTAEGTVLISNCVNSAELSLTDEGTAGNGQAYVGGIAGHMDTAVESVKLQILNCGNTGSVTAAGNVNQARVAGIVGRLRQEKDQGIKAQISNCYNAGMVDTDKLVVGGEWATLSVGAVIGQGRNLNLGAMNWMEGSAPTVGFNQNIEGLTSDFMKSDDFVEILNKNAQAMADAGIAGIIPWAGVSEGYPVIGSGAAIAVKDSWITDENAASGFGGGDGSESNPYLITNAAQLGYLAKQALSGDIFKDKYFKLTADLDLSAHQWVPIKKFAGVFNGNGKTISGLAIGTAENPVERLSANEWGAGLFNNVTGTVKNLTVEGSVHVADTMSGQHFGVAIIVGHLEGTLDNCTAKGTVTSLRDHSFAGGVAGVVAAGSTIINCANEASVSGGSPKDITRLGGIAGYVVVGRNSEASILIANCYNVGTITATSGNAAKAAGITANTENNNSEHTISIYNCYNAGEIKQGEGATGALLANSCATKSGKGVVNVKHLYASNTAVVEAITETVVTGNLNTKEFAEELTINADLLVGDKLCADLLSWVGEDGKNPTFGKERVTGTLAKLDVTSNNDRMGIITIVGDENGGNQFVPITKQAVEKGTKIQITIQPKSCIKLTSVKVNGVEKLSELTDGIMTFTVNEAVTVEITFEVEKTVDLEPIYVNANAAAGGDGSEAKPYATLEEAQAKLRTLLAVYPTGNITVYLMDGTYRLSETLTLTEEDSTFGRVTITGYKGCNPVISGAQTTGKFNKVDGKEYYSYQLPESAKVDGAYPLSHDLFVNGERAVLARTEDMVFQYGFENVVMTENGKYVDYADNSWYVNEELLAGVPDDELHFVELNYLQEWKHTMLHLNTRVSSKVQGTEVNVTVDSDELNELYAHCATLKSPVGETYWLQNHLAFLDKPGEYYYDQARGIIYYMPYSDQDMEKAQIEYGTLDILVALDHAENITFDGIDFEGATTNWATENGLPGQLSGTQYGKVPGWGDCGEPIPCAAIFGDYTTGIKVVNCIFEELGGSAMIFRFGTKDLEIIGNRMRNLGMCGVQIGVAQLKWNQDNIPGQAENITISNNYITNIGIVNLACPAIAVKRAENLKITHNMIVHTPYSAITAGWGFDHTLTDEASLKNLVNAEIAYNYIEDFIHKNNDGGGIYVCGANADILSPDPINFIHDNYIRAGAHNKTYTGIYHDGSASNWLTYHNFVDDLRSNKGPMFFQDDVQTQYTHNITVQDNFTTVAPITQNGSMDLLGNYRNIYMTNNTFFKNRGEASEEALEIMRNAGLEAEYAHLESPMSTEIRIADDSMHYEISLKTFNPVVMHIELSNNSNTARTYTITTDRMPAGYMLTVNGGKPVTVEAGQTVIVEAVFTISDTAVAKDEGDQVVGFVVSDSTGRETEYRRVFTIRGVNRVLEGDNGIEETPPVNIIPYIVIGVAVLAVIALAIVIILRRRKVSKNAPSYVEESEN